MKRLIDISMISPNQLKHIHDFVLDSIKRSEGYRYLTKIERGIISETEYDDLINGKSIGGRKLLELCEYLLRDTKSWDDLTEVEKILLPSYVYSSIVQKDDTTFNSKNLLNICEYLINGTKSWDDLTEVEKSLLPSYVSSNIMHEGGNSQNIPKKILILATHPDDDVLSFGGLIARSIERGDEVFVYCLCMGGPCSNVHRDVRIAEFIDVMTYLKVQRYDFPEESLDGLLDTLPSCELTGIIDKLIADYKPDEVYSSAYSEHSDHQALYKAVLGSARLKSSWMPKLFAIGTYPFSDQLYTVPSGGKIFQPLSEDNFNKKCEAFKLYKSQFKPSPSPLGIDGLRVRAEQDGMMCGSKYAELYYQLRYIRSI